GPDLRGHGSRSVWGRPPSVSQVLPLRLHAFSERMDVIADSRGRPIYVRRMRVVLVLLVAIAACGTEAPALTDVVACEGWGSASGFTPSTCQRACRTPPTDTGAGMNPCTVHYKQ